MRLLLLASIACMMIGCGSRPEGPMADMDKSRSGPPATPSKPPIQIAKAGILERGQVPAPEDAGKNPSEPEVLVVGVYEGTYPEGVRHRAGYHPPGTVMVKVGKVTGPVILVLTSYEPVVWKVDAPKGAVVRVIASGYHNQAVEGFDEKVPVTLFSHETGDRTYFHAYRKDSGRDYDHLVERVRQLTRRDIKGFRGKYAGRSFEIP